MSKAAEPKEVREFLIRVAVTATVTLFVLQVFHPYTVRETSMYPTLKDGDKILVAGLMRKPKRGQIVIFRDGKISLIKRVAGIPGDEIATKDGVLYINGVEKADNNSTQNFTLKEDEYYMLGDNLEVSRDSRAIGAVKEKQLRGTLLFRFFPSFVWWG